MENVRQVLSENSQQHLLHFWDQLNEEQKKLLYKDLKSLNLSKVCQIFEVTVNSENQQNEKIDDLLEPLSPQVHESITRTTKEKLQSYRENGQSFPYSFNDFYNICIQISNTLKCESHKSTYQ